MAANITPNYTVNGNLGLYARLTAANTKNDGSGTIGTDIFDVLDAGANGTFVDRIEFMPTSSVASTATTATVARVFISTQGTGATTNANTKCIGEVPLPSVTPAASPTVANLPIVFPMGYRIPANSHLLVTTHAAPATNTAWVPNPIAGDY